MKDLLWKMSVNIHDSNSFDELILIWFFRMFSNLRGSARVFSIW
jgi:hypothetical protein